MGMSELDFLVVAFVHSTMHVLVQIKCDNCTWWYHLSCVNKKLRGKKHYTINEAKKVDFIGPCCTKSGVYDFK